MVPFSSPALGFALGPGPIFGPGPWFCCYFAASVIGWAGAYYYLIGLPALSVLVHSICSRECSREPFFLHRFGAAIGCSRAASRPTHRHREPSARQAVPATSSTSWRSGRRFPPSVRSRPNLAELHRFGGYPRSLLLADGCRGFSGGTLYQQVIGSHQRALTGTKVAGTPDSPGHFFLLREPYNRSLPVT